MLCHHEPSDQLHCTFAQILQVLATGLNGWATFFQEIFPPVGFLSMVVKAKHCLKGQTSKDFQLDCDLGTVVPIEYDLHHFHLHQTIQWALMLCGCGWSHPGREHSYQDTSVSWEDRVDQSEELWIGFITWNIMMQYIMEPLFSFICHLSVSFWRSKWILVLTKLQLLVAARPDCLIHWLFSDRVVGKQQHQNIFRTS